MRIVNPKVHDDLRDGIALRLNLGCGLRPRPGFYGVDCVELPQVDIIADLNRAFDALPDNCVAEVFSRHTLEHITDAMGLFGELHRITQPGGRIEIIVPHFSNPYYYSDPTHVRFFGLYTLFYLADEDDQPRRKVPNFYVPFRFQVETVEFRLLRSGIVTRFPLGWLNRLINRRIGWLDWYERTLCRLWPVESVRYIVRPKKMEAVPIARTAA